MRPRPSFWIVALALLGLGATCDRIPSPCPDGAKAIITVEDGRASYTCPAPSPPAPSAPPTTQPPSTPSPTAPPTAVPPTPIPTAPPTVAPPTPKPPKPCKIDESRLPCFTCKARIEYEERHRNLTFDPASKRWFNDPPGKPREWFDSNCNKTDSAGNVVVKAFDWYGKFPESEQGLCPPEMLTCPSPSPSAAPLPIPTTAPSPIIAGPGAPEIIVHVGPNGTFRNYPVPPHPSCPAHFAGARTRVGIAVLGQRRCSSLADCVITNAHCTEKSTEPWILHTCHDERGNFNVLNCRREGELLHACQYPEFGPNFTGCEIYIRHPDWGNEWGIMDKRTADKCGPEVQDCRVTHIAHDQAINRHGRTGLMACPEGVAPDGPGCSETSFATSGLALGPPPRGASGRAPEPGIPTKPVRIIKPHGSR